MQALKYPSLILQLTVRRRGREGASTQVDARRVAPPTATSVVTLKLNRLFQFLP